MYYPPTCYMFTSKLSLCIRLSIKKRLWLAFEFYLCFFKLLKYSIKHTRIYNAYLFQLLYKFYRVQNMSQEYWLHSIETTTGSC